MTKIADIKDHVEAALEKANDLYDVHLPAIREFLITLERNPLVTAIESTIEGSLSGDALTVLNGLFPVVGALARDRQLSPGAPAASAGAAPAPGGAAALPPDAAPPSEWYEPGGGA